MAFGLGSILSGLGIGSGLNFLKTSVFDPLATGIGNLISGGTWQQSGNELAKQEWSRSMRQTAYQDTVADMQEAGLNPAMFYASGGNASATPSSASGSSSRSGVGMDLFGSLAQFFNSTANVMNATPSVSKKMQYSNSLLNITNAVSGLL